MSVNTQGLGFRVRFASDDGRFAMCLLNLPDASHPNFRVEPFPSGINSVGDDVVRTEEAFSIVAFDEVSGLWVDGRNADGTATRYKRLPNAR